MDNNNSQNFIQEYEQALENTPEEVRNFLWSDAYEGIINGIAKTCRLSIEQTNVVSEVLFDLTINAIDDIRARAKLSSMGISEENQEKIFLIGYEYIINPSITEAEETGKEEALTSSAKDGDLSTLDFSEPSTPTTDEVLANLGARLTRASVTPPTKRDYSMNNREEGTPSTPSAPKAFDPYRELPEK